MGYRLVMILLSQQHWPATRIAQVLGCDPRTVRRWVQRYNAHGANELADRPDRAARTLAAGGWVRGSAGCWPNPKRGPSRCCTCTWAAQP